MKAMKRRTIDMDIDSILTIIVAALPAVTSVATGIGVMYKIFKNFNALKKEVKEATELNDIREQFKLILEENLKLKEQLSALIDFSKRYKATHLSDFEEEE